MPIWLFVESGHAGNKAHAPPVIDLNYIPHRQEAIHSRLENWARWVKPRRNAWAMQPMFRMYQSKARHWDITPHIHIEVNALDGQEIEQAVCALPEKHRDAMRWFYVFNFIPPGKIQRELGVNATGLLELLIDSRDMLKNRSKINLDH